MDSFLDQLARRIRADYGEDVSQLAVVLPTRRAALFLRESLAKTYQQTIWAPQMLSIQDFIRSLTDWQFPEPLALIFELYKVYKKAMRAQKPEYHESFERFYAWGEMLLKDFDEVDKYLVDADGLFRNIRDLRRLEMEFGLSEEDAKALQRFWQSVHGLEASEEEAAISPVKKTFLEIWEVLGEVYREFGQRLKAKLLAYDGMAYRSIVEQLKAESLEMPYKQVIFAGFNALSLGEQEMIRLMLQQEKGRIFWDVDRTYFPEKIFKDKPNWQFGAISEEAGKFIRKLHPAWASMGSELILHDMQAEEKEVQLTGVPLQSAQARLLGQLLDQQNIPATDLRQHAIVLADENLLFPVLYAMPDAVANLNVTMGFPLRQTHVYHLLFSITSLIRNQLEEAGQLFFSHADVLQLLNSPYLKAIAPQLSEKRQKDIQKKNLFFVPISVLKEASAPVLYQHIFQPPKAAAGLIPYFEQLFDWLLKDAQERQALLEMEYIYRFYTLFNRFRDIVAQFDEPLSLRGFADMFREAMRKGRIPFEGEPLIGLQLMGILESRTLDFEHVYILGANEGSLPDTASGNSFIPYHLRKGFRMPTFEEKDAIFAYHFFRLIQRAKHVHLIYNSNTVDGGSSKEISRYLQQLKLYRHLFPNMKLEEKHYQLPAPFAQQPGIEIANGQQVEGVFEKNYLSQGRRFLSATALTTWLACPLRFYFKYLAEIREIEDLEESMEAGTFGTVLHSTMEYLYQPYVGKRVDEAAVSKMKKQLAPVMKQAFLEQNIPWDFRLQGKNYLYREVIEKLCKEILEQDAATTPFEILHLEEAKLFDTELKVEKRSFKLNGLFDRVDRMEESGRVRIVDYKTGKVSFPASGHSVAEVFDSEKWSKSNQEGIKEAFQGYLYVWLFDRKFPEQEVSMGYYTARKLKEGLVYLNNGQPISKAQIQEFEGLLVDLIDRMHTADFPQTTDEHRCSYCAYREICDR